MSGSVVAKGRVVPIWPVLALVPLAAVALVVLPRTGGSGSVGLGFDPALAHLIVVFAAVLCIAAYAAYAAYAMPGSRLSAAEEPSLPTSARWRVSWPVIFEALAVATIMVIAYFPPFLARYGPIGEDKYFLSAVQRMLAGQQPYADFEFIYGPLLIVPLAGWMSVFGYSLQSYYWILALVEAATFGLTALVLGAAIPNRRKRLAVLLVVLVLLIDDNLGLSWIALRRLLPVVILLLYAFRKRRPWAAAGVVLLIGVQFVLSLEYAAASILAIGCVSVLEAAWVRRAGGLLRTGALIGAGLGTGLAFAFLLLGSGTGDWLRATWDIIVLRGGGEAGFPFQLSVNAIAVLALLCLASARIGSGLWRFGRIPLDSGDLFLVAAVVYALVSLKSGLARSDMYHLVPPVLGLVAVVLLPLRFENFAISRRWRRAMVAATVIVCVTYAPGLAGAGRLWAQALVLGGRDVVLQTARVEKLPERTRGPWIGAERSEINPDLTPLAEYLADPARGHFPVVYYGQAWGADRYIGVPKPKGIYPTDDYLVSEQTGIQIRDFIDAHPSTLVVINRSAWESLHGAPSEPMINMYWIFRVRSVWMRFLEFWSSSHYGTAVLDEQIRKEARWQRTVGAYLLDRYVPEAEFGHLLVLSRRL